MGMYTELVCAFDLREDVPQNVIDILQYMVSSEKPRNFQIPDHLLFDTTRWNIMLQCDSFYFPGETYSRIGFDKISGWWMTIRCNLKNYDREIQKFIDWIQPYMNTHGFIGYMRYETEEGPTLLFNN